jgi:hypothetical protein
VVISSPITAEVDLKKNKFRTLPRDDFKGRVAARDSYADMVNGELHVFLCRKMQVI